MRARQPVRYPNSVPYPERHAGAPAKLFDRLLLRALGSVLWRLGTDQRRLARFANRVMALESSMAALDPDAFTGRVAACRARLLRDGEQDQSALTEAFALAREATFRVLGFRHHRVQLMGGRAMLDGRLIEMRTGEGKTVTALLPAAVRAMTDVKAHVITVNDYLAERDCEELKPIYEMLGLSVGLVLSDHEKDARRVAYACDVTYCTNKDVVFDYLKDRLAIGQRRGMARRSLSQLVPGQHGNAELLLQGLHFALIDEADNVLVDEARTPLILSASLSSPGDDAARQIALAVAAELVSGQDFYRRPQGRTIDLLAAAEPKLKASLALIDAIPGTTGHGLEMINQAVTALHCYTRDVDYIVEDGKIQIVDEFTGRVMPDRSWQSGLHQMVEAKEGCAATDQRNTIARISYQGFFRRYLALGGMSGTIAEVAGEMYEQFGTRLTRIPTHEPDKRIDEGACLLRSRAEKWEHVARAAARHAAAGRPVLVGTNSVSASEELADVLARHGLPHVVLNARQNAEEAAIIAEGGQPGRVTVATNMAGRGTDIKLAPAARTAGGLHVILTEYHESARIDRQLFGRAGRKGDPGSFEAIVALDDKLFRERLTALERALAGRWLAARSPARGLPLSALRRFAQARAERHNQRLRDNAVQRDHQLSSATAFAGVGE